MKKTEVAGTIEVEFDPTSEQEARKIIDSLSKNHYFISDILGGIKKISLIKKTENNLFVSGFAELKQKINECSDSYIRNVLPKQIDVEKEIIFLKFLLADKLNCINNYSPELASHQYLTAYLNLIYSILAVKYYNKNNTPEKALDFIFKLSADEKQTIFNWLNKRRRFDLFNRLLDEQYQVIVKMDDKEDAYDKFMKNNMQELISIIQKNFLSGKLLLSEEQDEIVDLPQLSKEGLNELCMEFLEEIDPTLKWLEIYKEANAKGHIFYLRPAANVEWCCLRGKKPTVVAPLTGTLSDFRDLIHEFTHYVAEKDLGEDQNISNALREYPAIFLESNVLKFLIKKGYNADLINKLDKQRNYWTQNNALDILPVLQYILQKHTEGPVTLENELEKYKSAYENLPDDTSEEVRNLMISTVNLEEKVITSCIDLENILLLTNPMIVLREYPYIIGQYLSDKTMEKLGQDPEILGKFLNITENIIDETPETVIEKLHLSTTELNSESKPIEYTKK